jgi:hypothetical protein
MHSAFRRGVELLSEPESDSVRRLGKIAENPSESTSKCMESTGWVPKNVMELKPVIEKLIQKVIIIAIEPGSANHNPGSSKRSWWRMAYVGQRIYSSGTEENVSSWREFEGFFGPIRRDRVRGVARDFNGQDKWELIFVVV